MNHPDDLLYSPDHMWVRDQDGVATVGVSDFGQQQLETVVYVDLPKIGQAVTAGEEMGFTVEGAKSMSDLFSPVTGKVVEVNAGLAQNPAPLQEDPYDSGWVVRVELTAPLPGELMDAAAYRLLVEG